MRSPCAMPNGAGASRRAPRARSRGRAKPAGRPPECTRAHRTRRIPCPWATMRRTRPLDPPRCRCGPPPTSTARPEPAWRRGGPPPTNTARAGRPNRLCCHRLRTRLVLGACRRLGSRRARPYIVCGDGRSSCVQPCDQRQVALSMATGRPGRHRPGGTWLSTRGARTWRVPGPASTRPTAEAQRAPGPRLSPPDAGDAHRVSPSRVRAGTRERKPHAAPSDGAWCG